MSDNATSFCIYLRKNIFFANFWFGRRLVVIVMAGITQKDTKMEKNEIKLVKAAMTGSASAFEQLVQLRFSLVHAIAYAQLADRQIAEDLAQEVFLRVYLHLDSLKSPEKFTAWLARITRNLAASWQRSNKRASLLLNKVIAENALKIETEGADIKMQEKEQTKLVCDAVFKLPLQQRQMVMLHYFENLNKSQIAQALDMNLSAVSRGLKNALTAMKESFEPMLKTAAPVMRPAPAAVKKALAVIGAVSVMSTAAKATLVTAAIISVTTKTATATGILGLSKTTATILTTGVIAMKAKTIATITFRGS